MSRQFELVLVVLWYSAQVVFGEYSYSQCSNLHAVDSIESDSTRIGFMHDESYG